MACYFPIEAYRGDKNYKTGKRRIVFSKKYAETGEILQLPCGQCIGCRLARSLDWAVRCVHEAAEHPENCFLTLTYNDDNLPNDGSLNVEHFQKFMKRLRKSIHPLKIKFFHCGEYGAKLSRPHYHALIFGYDFPDRELFTTTNGVPLYTSEKLQNLWKYGYSTVGDVTIESAAYVARYCTKKITGDAAHEHYIHIHPHTGVISNITPEYTTMSLGRKPGEGIGGKWFNKYETDVFPHDHVVILKEHYAAIYKTPRYYEKIYELENPETIKRIKNTRKVNAKKRRKDNTTDRLIVREKVKQTQFNKLLRPIEA